MKEKTKAKNKIETYPKGERRKKNEEEKKERKKTSHNFFLVTFFVKAFRIFLNCLDLFSFFNLIIFLFYLFINI